MSPPPREVNLKLDMGFRLETIGGVESRDARYGVKALVKDEESPALTALAELSQVSKADFKAVKDKLRMAASIPRANATNLGGVSKDHKNRGVYEISPKRHSARLFYFYLEEEACIVCLNSYWKTTDKGKSQSRAFDDAAELMEEYLEWRKAES